MNKEDWKEITVEDILKAIEIFNTEHPSYNNSRTTYLIYEGFDYPAKAIRKIAYKAHFGKEISVDEFNGGDDTVKFFLRLGFKAVNETSGLGKDAIDKTRTKNKPLKINKVENRKEEMLIKNTNTNNESGDTLKVGMVLEWMGSSEDDFDSLLEDVRASDIDLLVFPEECTHSSHVASVDCMCDQQLNIQYQKYLTISKRFCKPIIFGFRDSKDRLYSLYVNAEATEDETKTHLYVKHVMTGYSAFEEDNYELLSKDLFSPILLKGFKIGLTICYECEFPVFSRMYGLQGVDLIINCTGSGVVAHKWGLFNMVRAIENNCSVLVTMKKYWKEGKSKSRTFGYNSLGGELEAYNLYGPEREWDKNDIYVYEVKKPYLDTKKSEDNINAERAENKNSQLSIPINNIESILSKSSEIDHGIFCYPIKERKENLIVCLVDGMDILKPEKVLPMLYNPLLKMIKHKRYVIVNKHEHLTNDELCHLSPVLKVRAMENFVVVILESDNYNKCYQTSFNKMSQTVMPSGNVFKIDVSRATGPEATWKDKNGNNMLKKWRINYEWLLAKFTDMS